MIYKGDKKLNYSLEYNLGNMNTEVPVALKDEQLIMVLGVIKFYSR